LATVIAAAALAVLAAACGGGGSTTYTNKDYKFSVTYDSSLLTESTSTSAAGAAGGKSVFDVGFVDPKGTKIGGKYRDGMIVSIYKLTQTVTDSMLPLVKTELEGILPQLKAALGGNATLGSLTDVNVNGAKGFASDATFTWSGTAFKAKVYFLIKGNLEYQATAQAAESRWSDLQPVFKTMMDSFKVTQ